MEKIHNTQILRRSLYTQKRRHVNTTLFQCWPAQRRRHVNPMLFQCWPSVYDAGPALKQHWVNVSCLQGSGFYMVRKWLGGLRSNSYLSCVFTAQLQSLLLGKLVWLRAISLSKANRISWFYFPWSILQQQEATVSVKSYQQIRGLWKKLARC